MLRNSKVLRVVDNLVDAAQNPDHQRFNQVGILLVVHSLKIEALEPGETQAVLGVVEDGVINAVVFPLRVGDLVEFLIQLIICLLIINYWVTPFPGASFGFNHLFSYFAQVIVAALDQNSLSQLQSALSNALNSTPQPSYLAPLEILTYLLVYVFVGMAAGILFLVNCSSFIFYGVAALFGPLFVPLLMSRTFRGKFYNFVDVLLSFAMIRAVAAAFIFVWSGFLITFLQQTFNGDYSLPMWIANLYGVIAVFIAFILNMAMVPTITQTLFGGGSGAAGRVMQIAETLVMRAAMIGMAA